MIPAAPTRSLVAPPAVLLWVSLALPAQAPSDYATAVQPLLQRYCYRCHGEEKQKGDMRLDVLDPDMVRGPHAESWHAALDKINGAEMPPDDEAQFADEERRLVVAWLTESLKLAVERRKGERRTVLRRLTKAQYTNTLQDLLGVRIDFGRVLPDDGKSKMGFSNNGEVLQASPLHLDYYQEVARQALAQAIVTGSKPEPVRYLVTFGRGIGAGKVAGTTGGYQAVPLDTADFTVEVLDAQGAPKVGADAAARQQLDRIRRKVSVGLRGSSQDRFRVVDEGVMLYSALPHKEEAPGSWQGPSPNLELELQRCFPERGDFVMRVRAQQGYIPTAHEQLLVSLDDPTPRVQLADDGAVSTGDGAIVLRAEQSDQRENVRLQGDMLHSVDVPEPSKAALRFQLPTDGFYQVDLVHPVAAAEAMASVRLSIDGMRLDLRPALSDEQRQRAAAITALGATSLRAGEHALELGGPFFIGFSHVVITPLPLEHAFVRRSTVRIEELTAAYAGKQPVLRTFAGTRTDDGMVYLGFGNPAVVAAPLGTPATYVFEGRLEDMPIPEPESGDDEILSGILVVGLWNDHLVKARAQTGPPLLLRSIELEAPYYPVWPPKSHTDIFVEVPGHDPRVAGNEGAYTRALLEHFMQRAFRRPLLTGEVEPYVDFWREVRQKAATYEDSVREVLVAVLCSPNFLFLVEPRSEPVGEPATSGVPAPAAAVLSEHGLAARLSYFLWNSPPDATLGELAQQGALRAQLPQQVDRLLEDPRAWRFVRAFAREWLRLDRFENVTIHADRFPAFTRFVKRDMAEETYHYLHEVLRTDASILQLIDADFAMLNQNLAEFYGIAGVAGPEFRRVAVTAEQRRGGLLSQGSFLAGHSDGTSPHPIKRAVWLKKQILGDEPPPPPPNVPRLDPDKPGADKLSLEEQLELHRDSASCRDCHKGIDPYGIAFENYSAVGLFERKRRGVPIDARTTLPGGREIDGVDALKRWLIDEQSAVFARAFIEHLFAYALGRDIHFADKPELARILEQVKMDGLRVRSVIRHIVASESFTQF